MRTSGLAALLCTAALIVTPAAAGSGTDAGSAASGPPLALGPTETVSTFPTPSAESTQYPNPIAVTDARGTVTAVWAAGTLAAAQRDPGGHWGAPVGLGSCPAAMPSCVTTYAVVVDAAGTATVAWSTWDTVLTDIYVATLAPGGTWSAPTHVSAQHTSAYVGLAAAGHDRAVLAFAGGTWRHPTVTALYKAPGVRWEAAARRTFRDANQPVVGVSDHGVAVLVVRRGLRHDQLMRSYRFRPGSGWGRAHTLGAAMKLDLVPYSLVTAPTGRSLLAYLYDPLPDSAQVWRPAVRARVMTRRGTWRKAHTLAPAGSVSSEYLPVTIGRKAVVAWSTTREAIRVATLAPGTGWKVRTAYPRRSGQVWQVEHGPGDDLTMLWNHGIPGPALRLGRYTPAGWSPALPGPPDIDEMGVFGCIAPLPDGSGLLLTNGTITGGFSVLAHRFAPAS